MKNKNNKKYTAHKLYTTRIVVFHVKVHLLLTKLINSADLKSAVVNREYTVRVDIHTRAIIQK